MKVISLFGVNLTLKSFKTLSTLLLTAGKGMILFWMVALYYDRIVKYENLILTQKYSFSHVELFCGG